MDEFAGFEEYEIIDLLSDEDIKDRFPDERKRQFDYQDSVKLDRKESKLKQVHKMHCEYN